MLCVSCGARPPARAVTHIALVRLRSQSTCSRSVRLPIAFARAGRSQENERSSLASRRQQSKHPRPADTAEETKREWNARNWQTVTGSYHRSGTPKNGPGIRRMRPDQTVRRRFEGRLTRQTPSMVNRYGKRPGVSRIRRSWPAATAVATTWRRASSSDAIAGAGSASLNAMGPQHGRRRRGSRSRHHTVR